jgi:hypothetical protein
LLFNKLRILSYIGAVCIISTSCTSINLNSTTIKQQKNHIYDREILATYQKSTGGSRLTFTVGILKEVNSCIYLSNDNGDVPIIFPNTFKMNNNFVSNGNLVFEIGKEASFIGHQTSVENAISALKIPNNRCFNGKNMIWVFGQ